MTEGRWDGVPDVVRQRVERHLREESPRMLLQVGSTARGYALPDSDHDFMAFFDDEREKTTEEMDAGGFRVAVECISLRRFSENTADFRFNLASLRELHKVRDGIHRVEPAAGTDHVLNAAAGAHLDRSVLLAQCVRVAEQAGSVREWPVVAQHQQLLEWTELLGMLSAVSRPGVEAYTKPKWLPRTLEKAGESASLRLLLQLYRWDGAEPRALLAGLERHWSCESGAALPARHRKLLTTALADASAAVEHFPDRSFTQLRFAAGLTHRLSRDESPLAVLAAGGRLPGPVEAAMRCDVDIAMDVAWDAFLETFASLASAAVADARRGWRSGAGSRRFFGHVLAFYDAASLLPHTVEDRVEASARTVEEFLLTSGLTPAGRG